MQTILNDDHCRMNACRNNPGFYPVIGTCDGLQWMIGISDSEESAQIKLSEWYAGMDIAVVVAKLRPGIYRRRSLMAYWPHITYERKTK